MAGIDGFATTLARETVTPGTYAVIANVTALKPPAIKRNTIDVTAHDSTGQWMEFLGGLKDGGEVSFDVNYAPDLHDVLLADLSIQGHNWRVTFPDAVAWTFKAILTGYAPDAPYDDKLSATITLKVTGVPTFA